MNWFRALASRSRLLLLFGLMIALLAIVLATAYRSITTIQGSQGRFYETHFTDTIDVLTLHAQLNGVRAALLSMMIASTRSEQERWHEDVAVRSKEVDDTVQRLLETASTHPQRLRQLQEINQAWAAFRQTRDTEIIPFIYQGRIEDARAVILGVQEERYQKFRSLAAVLGGEAIEEARLGVARSAESVAEAVRVFVVVGIAALFLGVMINYSLTRLAGELKRRVEERTQALSAEIAVRKQAEEGLRQIKDQFLELLENAPDAMVIVNGAGRITLLNKRADQLFGYAREELFGQPIEILLPERFRSIHKAHRSHYMVGPRVRPMTTRLEIYGLRKDGTEVPVEIALAPLNTAEGLVISAAIRDITERKQMELQLSKSQRMEAIGRLAGGVAHDFNNHLGIIIGYSELLFQRLGSGDPLRRNAEMIKEAAQRSAALTQQLLAFGRRQVLEPRILDLNAVVTELTKMLRPVIREDIELATSLAPALGKVEIDPTQIEQVIMNLALNARDAMPQGGRLTIETANVELDEGYADLHTTVVPGPYAMLAVSDTGTGMNPQTQENIFEPFFTTKEQGKGTGLGLAVVYGIVKQSRGYIWVYSEPGQGATFKIYLPRVEKDIQKANPDPASYPTPKGVETILVVEDEAILRELACTFLKGAGYQVLEASDGAKAVQISENYPGPIHLMLTDGGMPGMSGRQLAKHVLAARPGLQVLYMSGYTDDVVLRNGMVESEMAFLQKPFTQDALLLRIRQVLDSSQ